METITEMQLETNEISLKNHGFPEGEFLAKPTFKRTIGRREDGKYYTQMSVVFMNTEENPFPVDMTVTITGLFDLKGQSEEYIDKFLKENAVQMLFPYIRSIISSVTAASFMQPMVLPVINPISLFEEE